MVYGGESVTTNREAVDRMVIKRKEETENSVTSIMRFLLNYWEQFRDTVSKFSGYTFEYFRF
jgi:hypothetical protein